MDRDSSLGLYSCIPNSERGSEQNEEESWELSQI
jgi:hypothetical protein